MYFALLSLTTIIAVQAVEDDRQICEDKVEEALETNEKKDYGEENELEQEEEEMFHDRSLVGSAITKFSFYMEALYGEEEGVRGTGKEKEKASARRRAEEMEEDVKSFVFLLFAHIGPMRGGASLDSENVAWNIGEQASFARLITRCVFAVVQPWVLASCARARERETIGLMSALAALKALQEEEVIMRYDRGNGREKREGESKRGCASRQSYGDMMPECWLDTMLG